MIRWLLVLFWLPVGAWAQDIRQIEQNLAAIRFNPGIVDGVADANTRSAITAFQFSQGFDATGNLTPFELSYLAQIAANSRLETPFVIDVVTDPDEPKNGSPRSLFANGLHYAAVARYRTYNPRDVQVGTDRYVALKDANADRRDAMLREAAVLAQRSQEPLALALIHLSNADRTDDELQQTQRALATLLQYAEAYPQEPAYAERALSVVTYHAVRHRLCEAPDNEELRALMRRSLKELDLRGRTLGFRRSMIGSVLNCVRGDERDAFFQESLALAGQETPRAYFFAAMKWAGDLMQRGNLDGARTLYRQAAELFFSGKTQDPRTTSPFDKLFPQPDALNMVRLGMALEVAKISQYNQAVLEGIDTTIGSGSYLFSISYLGLIQDTSHLMILSRNTAGIKQLGTFLHNNNIDYGGFETAQDTSHHNEQDVLWGGAMVSLNVLAESADKQPFLEAVAIVLPEMLRDGAQETALQASLLQTQAALETGAYEVAEPAMMRAISIAQTSGSYDRKSQEIRALRRELNLSKLADLSPAERLLEQMNIYYADACQTLDAAKMSFEDFIDVDYVALSEDPKIAQALVKSNAMNGLLGCFFPQRLTGAEARFLCAVAGFSDRRDVAEYILAAEWEGIESWHRYPIIEQCAYGLVDSGRTDWIRLETIEPPDEYNYNNLWFMTQTAQTRQDLIAKSSMLEVGQGRIYEKIGMQLMEKQLTPFERKRLSDAFHGDFVSSYGRIGPSKQEQRVIINNAIAFQRLGYFGTAEVYFANDRRVDPFAFGTEDRAALNAELLRPEHIRLRLRYAKLYLEWGKPDRAYAAIGHLAEQAIDQLGSDTSALPGTVEQWAKRLENLFSAYLELQFEGLTEGPNYPAIFAIQQYLQLADSTASASVLEQRINSANPQIAREYQDAQRAIRAAMRDPEGQGSLLPELSLRLQAIEGQLPRDDGAFKSHQIGVMRPLREAMLALREENAEMLVITQLSDAVILMVLDGKNARAKKLEIGAADVQSTVTTFRRGIIESSAENDKFDTDLAQKIYADLIGWAHVSMPPPKELRVVSSGAFSSLPFAALRYGDGWLGISTTLRAAPSVARGTQSLRRSTDVAGFIGLGDPNLTEGDVAARRTLLGSGTFLAELPETAAELAFMAIVFGGNPKDDVFTRALATEGQMQVLNAENRLERVAVLALATHGLLSRETGSLKSAGLVLSLPQSRAEDGILTASEIYNYRIGADLVVLSACNTGTPSADKGLSDLASAFLYAGAGALMLTHWEIDSGAAVELTKRIAIENLNSQTGGYESALQSAIAKLLADETNQKFHHPRFWASHFVLG